MRIRWHAWYSRSHLSLWSEDLDASVHQADLAQLAKVAGGHVNSEHFLLFRISIALFIVLQSQSEGSSSCQWNPNVQPSLPSDPHRGHLAPSTPGRLMPKRGQHVGLPRASDRDMPV